MCPMLIMGIRDAHFWGCPYSLDTGAVLVFLHGVDTNQMVTGGQVASHAVHGFFFFFSLLLLLFFF